MTTHKNQVGQDGAGINGGEFARKVPSDAADEILATFEQARAEQRRASLATMAAAAEAIPAVVTAFDEDIATVYFGYDSSYGLHPTHFAEEDGVKFPATDLPLLHAKLFDAAGAITDYSWINGPESPFVQDEDDFTLRVPGTDPVGRHIRMTVAESSWPLAGEALDIIRNRETVDDEELLGITVDDIWAFSEDYIDRALSNLSYDLAPEDTEEPEIDPDRAEEIKDHLSAICTVSGYNTMTEWLEAVYDRGLVSDDTFTEMTDADVTRLYDMWVAPAIDKIEDRLNYNREDEDEED